MGTKKLPIPVIDHIGDVRYDFIMVVRGAMQNATGKPIDELSRTVGISIAGSSFDITFSDSNMELLKFTIKEARGTVANEKSQSDIIAKGIAKLVRDGLW